MNIEPSNTICINDFMENPGLRNVFKLILFFLDEKSLKNCRRVSKSWNTFVTIYDKNFWIFQLQKCKTLKWCRIILRGGALILHKSILQLFPEFSQVFDYVQNQATFRDLITFQNCRKINSQSNDVC